MLLHWFLPLSTALVISIYLGSRAVDHGRVPSGMTFPLRENVMHQLKLLFQPRSLPNSSSDTQQNNTGKIELASCQLGGKVDGCGCDYASTEALIHDELHPTLEKIVSMPFFKYFKVNLYCDCEFWPDAGMCFSKDCCVEACEDSEIPEPWRREVSAVAQESSSASKNKGHILDSSSDLVDQQPGACSDPISPVDRSVDEVVASQLSSVQGWRGLNNPWIPEDDAGVDYVYVNLRLNPERYTGYKGEDARRIWAAIYAQSAFAGVTAGADGTSTTGHVALEKQTLYRLISGMHSSITASIIKNFYNETSESWGLNLPFFKARFTGPGSHPYIENLYFTFLFLLRAVIKAGPALGSLSFETGSPADDLATQKLIQSLLNSPKLSTACPEPFNEGLLWQDRDVTERQLLEKQLQNAFHNITKLMDCVGCEKCKLHGKLQILGIAASLKILFSQHNNQQGLTLHRNEAIALMNLLSKVADSVDTVRQLSMLVPKG